MVLVLDGILLCELGHFDLQLNELFSFVLRSLVNHHLQVFGLLAVGVPSFAQIPFNVGLLVDLDLEFIELSLHGINPLLIAAFHPDHILILGAQLCSEPFSDLLFDLFHILN